MSRFEVAARAVATGVAVVVVWPFARSFLAPKPAPPTPEMLAHALGVSILRDSRGIPHIFGKTDADAAFGLAYAHSEDDWPTIQGVLAAARGTLGLVKPGKLSLLNDWFAGFVGVEAEIAAGWDRLPQHTRDVLDAYAQGLDLYAFDHPREADGRLLPFTGRDIARGFAHKMPFMIGVDRVVKGLSEGDPGEAAFPGSNAIAVSHIRAPDATTRLDINSHQPWEGPVSWYEVQIHSDEGWNASGGLFPGAPMVLHGFNDHLGWAMTVNAPDLVDVYALVTDAAHPGQYKFDGQWRDLTSERIWLPLDTPWFTAWIPQTIERSVQGPVYESGGVKYAIRFASQGTGADAADEWFAMNKATNLDEWRAAADRGAIPMFNLVYADKDHVGAIYNARIPDRKDGFDYHEVLPGDDPATVWETFWPEARLPQVWDPASGFVQACNSAPWVMTTGPETPKVEDFPVTAGIEGTVTNRARRVLELLGDGEPVDRGSFLATKWDRTYADDAPIVRRLLEPLAAWQPTDPDEVKARDRLLAWDRVADPKSVAAAIALLAWRKLDHAGGDIEGGAFDPVGQVQWALRFLRENFGRTDVTLGEVQRLQRGTVDLPLGGGPDLLNATYHHLDGGRMVGDQGDSLVMIVDFAPDGAVRAEAISPYGASNRPGSRHYADQSRDFVERQLQPVWRTEAEIRANLETEYHPGHREEP